jgi:hypothetical protein
MLESMWIMFGNHFQINWLLNFPFGEVSVFKFLEIAEFIIISIWTKYSSSYSYLEWASVSNHASLVLSTLSPCNMHADKRLCHRAVKDKYGGTVSLFLIFSPLIIRLKLHLLRWQQGKERMCFKLGERELLMAMD